MRPTLFMEIIGWTGSAMVVTAYALISMRRIHSGSLYYQALNLVGGIMLIAFTVYKHAYPPATVNTIWAVIAFISILQIGVRKLRKKRDTILPPRDPDAVA